MTIERIETGPRMSMAVLHGDTVYLTPDTKKLHRFGQDGKALQ